MRAARGQSGLHYHPVCSLLVRMCRAAAEWGLRLEGEQAAHVTHANTLCCLLLQGWVLYLDGQQAAQITHAVTDLSQLQTPGGDPLLLNNSVHLCGRADSEPDRFFDGTLAALSFFNQSLLPTDVSSGCKLLPCLHLLPAVWPSASCACCM